MFWYSCEIVRTSVIKAFLIYFQLQISCMQSFWMKNSMRLIKLHLQTLLLTRPAFLLTLPFLYNSCSLKQRKVWMVWVKIKIHQKKKKRICCCVTKTDCVLAEDQFAVTLSLLVSVFIMHLLRPTTGAIGPCWLLTLTDVEELRLHFRACVWGDEKRPPKL